MNETQSKKARIADLADTIRKLGPDKTAAQVDGLMSEVMDLASIIIFTTMKHGGISELETLFRRTNVGPSAVQTLKHCTEALIEVTNEGNDYIVREASDYSGLEIELVMHQAEALCEWLDEQLAVMKLTEFLGSLVNKDDEVRVVPIMPEEGESFQDAVTRVMTSLGIETGGDDDGDTAN